MDIDASLETNTGKSYPIKNRLLIPLYERLDSYCNGYEGSESLKLIEPFFDNQACIVLGPIVDAHYYAPDRDYAEHDFERYLQNNLPRADGVPFTEADFLAENYRINHIWRDINHYIKAIKQLIPAINHLHSLKQDPIEGYGPSVLKELLRIPQRAAQEGAEKVRIAWV